MRKLLILLFVLVGFVVNGQTLRQFEGVASIYGSSGTGPVYNIKAFYFDQLGYYSSDSTQVGDVLYVLNGGACARLEVTTINSKSGGLLNLDVTDIDGVMLAPPSGKGGITRETSNKGLPMYMIGISESLRTCVGSHLAVKSDTLDTSQAIIDSTFIRNDSVFIAVGPNEFYSGPSIESVIGVDSLQYVRDTVSLTPNTGDQFVNSTKDTSGVYASDRWLLSVGGSSSGLTVLDTTFTSNYTASIDSTVNILTSITESNDIVITLPTPSISTKNISYSINQIDRNNDAMGFTLVQVDGVDYDFYYAGDTTQTVSFTPDTDEYYQVKTIYLDGSYRWLINNYTVDNPHNTAQYTDWNITDPSKFSLIGGSTNGPGELAYGASFPHYGFPANYFQIAGRQDRAYIRSVETGVDFKWWQLPLLDTTGMTASAMPYLDDGVFKNQNFTTVSPGTSGSWTEFAIGSGVRFGQSTGYLSPFIGQNVGGSSTTANFPIIGSGLNGGILMHMSYLTNDGFSIYAADGTAVTTGNNLFNTSYLRFRIRKDNGNVGIGVTTPDEKLVVDGNVKADSYLSSTTTVSLGDSSATVLYLGERMRIEIPDSLTGLNNYVLKYDAVDNIIKLQEETGGVDGIRLGMTTYQAAHGLSVSDGVVRTSSGWAAPSAGNAPHGVVVNVPHVDTVVVATGGMVDATISSDWTSITDGIYYHTDGGTSTTADVPERYMFDKSNGYIFINPMVGFDTLSGTIDTFLITTALGTEEITDNYNFNLSSDKVIFADTILSTPLASSEEALEELVDFVNDPILQVDSARTVQFTIDSDLMNQVHPMDCSSAAITIDVTAIPNPGDWFIIADVTGNASTNNITIDFVTSAQDYYSTSQNKVISVDEDTCKFIYTNSTNGWISMCTN